MDKLEHKLKVMRTACDETFNDSVRKAMKIVILTFRKLEEHNRKVEEDCKSREL